jgi:diguanylate cyclase (GGDEF)-like protein
MDADSASVLSANAGASSWLCRDDFDRERMLDMESRIRPLRRQSFAILAVALLAMTPWTGWGPPLFLIPTGIFFGMADSFMPRIAKPEYLMFAAWIGTSLMIAGAAALAGGPRVATLSWLSLPVIALGSRFSMTGVVTGVLICIALVIAVAFGVDAHVVVSNPVVIFVPVGLVVIIGMLSIPLVRSDIQHRSDAVIDQLTGMLNRKALSTRSEELAQQALISGDPVGMIVCDLDHFKEINDTHGHTVGDAVLKDVAYLLRKQLRAFDLAYRLGGEEFLILLPGSELERAVELAERLRRHVAEMPLAGGVPVTMSFGVSASGRDEPFDYQEVFAEADAALYRAKRGGRNQVCMVGSAAIPAIA